MHPAMHPIDPCSVYAVITGDCSGFSRLERRIRQSMPGLMAGAGQALGDVLPGIMVYPISVFRGDSWQALIAAPGCALRAAVFIRAYLKAFSGSQRLDTRMAIGVGPVDYVPEGLITAGDGPAFRESGKMLEKMTSPRAGHLRYAGSKRPFEAAMDALCFSTGALINAWRPLQARAVIGRLSGLTQAQIAGQWPEGVTPQAVSGHLKKAGWPAISYAMTVFEQYHDESL